MANRLEAKPIPLITWSNMAPPFKDHVYFQHWNHFPFELDADRYSPINAWWLSEAALLAYAEMDFAAPLFESAGFDDLRFFSGRSTQCYVAANRKVAIVAFRGTECGFNRGPEAMAQFIADLRVDVDIRMVDAQIDGKIHRGFHDALDEIWDDLYTCLITLASKNIALWLTGHSLGGALAKLTADRHPKVAGIYTFGAPRVGNRKFASAYPAKCFSVVNNNDMVPHLPTFPYVDLGELHYIDSKGAMHADIGTWQRWKDEIEGHIKCTLENALNLDHGWSATLPDGLKDHTPLLYALHLWNNLIEA